MNASTPIPPGSVIYIDKNDMGDPETTLIAYLVKPDGGGGTADEPIWEEIACSPFITGEGYLEAQQRFLWVMSSLATFHNLQIQNQSGIDG